MSQPAPDPDAAERVLTAAAALFAERGYAGTTTRAIAERAGVNEVTLFRRFGTKAGVLKALARRMAERTAGQMVEDLEAGDVDGGGTRSTFAALAATEVRTALRDGGLALRLAFDARSVPEVAELLAEGSGTNFAGLARYVAARQRRGELRADVDADLLTAAFFALTSSFVLGQMLMGATPPAEGPDLDRLVDQLVDLYWSGARPTDRTTDHPEDAK